MDFPGLSKLSALGARMAAMKQAREGTTSDMLLAQQQNAGPNYLDPSLLPDDQGTGAPINSPQTAAPQRPTQTEGPVMPSSPMAPQAPGQQKLPSPPAMSSLRDVQPRTMASQAQGQDRKYRAAF